MSDFKSKVINYKHFESENEAAYKAEVLFIWKGCQTIVAR